MPWAAIAFLRALRARATFERTPKESGAAAIGLGIILPSVLVAVIELAAAWFYWSPFSPLFAAHGCALLGVPIYSSLNHGDCFGRIARMYMMIPGLLVLWALRTMWYWTKL
jgi:hypothetical protein